MYTKCLHCNCQLKNSVYNIYNMRLVITIERLPWNILKDNDICVGNRRMRKLLKQKRDNESCCLNTK